MWLLALLPLVLVAVFYARLPDQVPMHWGFDGEIDRYGSKNELWLMGALGPLFALLFQFLPRLDPKKRNYEKFQKYYEAIRPGPRGLHRRDDGDRPGWSPSARARCPWGGWSPPWWACCSCSWAT